MMKAFLFTFLIAFSLSLKAQQIVSRDSTAKDSAVTQPAAQLRTQRLNPRGERGGVGKRQQT